MGAAALVAAVLAVAATVPASAAAPVRDGDLLDRHRPVLAYDRGEVWRAVAVEPFVADGLPPRLTAAATPRRAGDVAYGRVTRDAGRTWLQYWLFFAYNGQDRGVVRTGRHEGDWELVQVGLGQDGGPAVATFTQHSSSAGCSWGELERGAGRPRVYVANASHALYPRRGVHDRPFPDPNDEARGGGREALPAVRVITARQPGWVAWDGRWGGSRPSLVPGEQGSPRGPAFAGDRWSHPARVHERSRDCFTAPGGAWWAVPGLAALGGGIAVALILAVRRRRRRMQGRGPVTLGP